MSSINNIIYAKLNPPRSGTEMIWRKRLLNNFSGHEYKRMTIVSAPTGYGKTVLISQFASINNKHIVWYQLDEYDNDFNVFIRYLITGISRKVDHFGMQTLDYIEKTENLSKKIRTVVTLLANELQARVKDGLEIILDDYHMINEKDIHKFIEELIQYLPDGIHLIISTRYQLPLNIVRLKAHGLINEINHNHLKFNKDEIRRFFNEESENNLADGIIAKYELETDGWAVALSLMKTASRELNSEKSVSFKWKRREDIYNYFAEEVFQQLPIELQTFLVHTSVIDVLTPNICNVLTGREDSDELLKIIIKQNIFLARYEGEKTYYRYHHLFKDFLEQHLGDKKQKQLERVGEYFAGKKYYEQAIENYILAGAYEKATLMIEKTGIKMIKAKNWQTINRWLQKIPPKFKENSPCFMLLRGVMYNQKGLWDEALMQIDEAIKLFSAKGTEIDLANASFQKAIVFRRSGRLQDSLDELNKIIFTVKNSPIIEWYDIALEKVNTLLWSGALDKAVETLKRGIEFAKRDGEHRLIAYFMENLGATYYAMGDYYKAIKYYEISKEEYMLEYDSLSEVEKERYSQRTTLSAIYRDWGELDKALELIRQEIDTKERLGFIDDLPRAYNQLALICNDKGNKQDAEKYFKYSSELYERLDRRDFQWTWHLAIYGKILIDNGKTEKGKALIEKAIKYAEKNSDFNLALCEFIGCYVYISAGRITEAIELLEHDLEVAKKVGARNLICQCCWALANVYIALGHKEKSKNYGIQCFELAREGNYLQIFLSYKQTSFPVIKHAIELGIEEDFLEKIVLRLGIKAETMLLELSENKDIVVLQRAKELLQKVRQEERPLRNEKKIPVSLELKVEWINVYCFGNFEVYAKGETKPIRWKTTKAMELFAYFLKNVNQTVNKDKILEDIWPDTDPEQTAKWLHTYVYQIRNVLKRYGIKNGLIYKNNGYSMKTEGIVSDANEFEKLANISLEDKTENVVESLKKAIDLYKGNYLDGFYNDWVMDEKDRLEQLHLLALEKLAKICMIAKEYKSATNYLHRMIKTNPFLENAQEMLMITYGKMGDRMALINHYEDYCKTLKNELSIEPKKEMKDLYNKLITGK